MRHSGPVLISGLVLSFLLAACSGAGNQATPVLAIGLTPGKELATIWLSPTPIPSPFVAPEATATPAPTQPLPTLNAQATLPISTIGALGPTAQAGAQSTLSSSTTSNCATTPAQPFAQVWQSNSTMRQGLGCPVGQPQQRNMAFQNFEHGFMFWSAANREIFILSTSAILSGQQTDTWWRLPDTFSDSDPIRDDSLVPPSGLLQPERGFGKVWRDNGFVREATGWATQHESGYSASWLTFERGWMMTGPDETSLLFAMASSSDGGSSTGIHYGPHPISNP